VAAAVWIVAAVWVGVLFVMANTVWQGAGPTPTPEQAFFGIPASAMYVAALYGGTLLMTLAVVLPGTREPSRSVASPSSGAPGRSARDPV
jgi:TRAP-type C4-dicarboxylate transport system permease small subunit